MASEDLPSKPAPSPSAIDVTSAAEVAQLNGKDARVNRLGAKAKEEVEGFGEELLPQLSQNRAGLSPLVIPIIALGLLAIGVWLNLAWLGLSGSLVILLLSLRVVWPFVQQWIEELVSQRDQSLVLGLVGLAVAGLGLLRFTGASRIILQWASRLDWNIIGALGDFLGAVGQILIAILAVYIAWRQYVISKDLTIQQNLITQQQTIDTYFQGISDLVLDEEGLLEDWPQERAIAEGRTAAILSSVDASGKAKIVRFLSRARLLTPLKRDQRLGRAILDGHGGYEEDRRFGVRVIDLGVMLAGANLAGTDLRWTDLSEANLVRADLRRCDLVKSNLTRTVLFEANLQGADLNGTRLFYGDCQTASPRTRTDIPNFQTGEMTGTVVEGANFANAQNLSDSQRYYLCAWCGSKTRSTIPGGCQGIPNKLGR